MSFRQLIVYLGINQRRFSDLLPIWYFYLMINNAFFFTISNYFVFGPQSQKWQENIGVARGGPAPLIN